MIDIPLGKALVPVEAVGYDCNGCILKNDSDCIQASSGLISCLPNYRKDGKTVIFRLVDWPGEEKE